MVNSRSLYNKVVKNKTILHMDGDAFFVAVEIAKNPKLKGLPVVTGEEKGIVTALSYEAKALGVTRGLPIFMLKKNFPKVIIMPGDYRSYAEYSLKMFNIVRRYADDVEEYSIDECFADLTGLDRPLKMSYEEIALKIKKEINEELGLSISIGLANTKVLAKLASKWKKPNGFTVIEQGKQNDFLLNTSIEKIWGIGRQTTEFLRKKGIRNALDFSSKKVEWIRDNLSEPYEVIWNELNGISLMNINSKPKLEYSSIQKTRSFHPFTKDKTFLISQLSKHVEDACAKARHYDLVPKEIYFFLKTRDFVYKSKKVPLTVRSNTPEIIMSLILKYFDEIYDSRVMYRTTGITLSGLTPGESKQSDLFGGVDRANKFELIHKQIDLLENKYGKRIVHLASTHKALKGDKKGTDVDDLDRDLLFI